ncbi:hypothetical protein CIB95_00780 [Lottiidibacillus patelloidae]|uniref:YhaN AAA domain-containing protein n=1 Tax=Lottiidibacillus patelloidae TaxID=2670334 RepID=A0A263BYA9_9BACI|nr:AAA family ATPase [Lottiidibacillus patelloidae]OZM58146.1 hypothetical protein CIB95_00780 [Lottiidibacillus patelloidae]
MKLTKIDIYGFGQFENFSMTFNENFQVIYGVNEAGKSTMMNFIKCILFGFPNRNKNIYLPKGSKRYGGSVSIKTKNYGTLTIERIDENKNITVFCEDGSKKGEDFLAEILTEIDETHFEGIFSFGIDGLQDIEKIQDDELNDFLLGAGMTGNVSISGIEQRLEKKQQELFRVSGKKPKINEQIKVLDTLESKINAWKEKRQSYDHMLENQKGLHVRLEQIKQDKSDLIGKYKTLEKVESLLPLHEEKVQLLYQLQELTTYEPFPEEGLHRFEQWKSQYITVKAEQKHYERQLNEIEKNINEIKENRNILAAEKRIQHVRENESLYDVKLKEKATLELDIKNLREDLQLLVEKLGKHWSISDLTNVDTSISTKEKLILLLDSIESHEQKKKFFEESYFQSKQKRDELLQEKEHYEKMLLTEDEQITFNEKYKIIGEKELLEKNLKEVESGTLLHITNSWKEKVIPLSLLGLTAVLFLKGELIIAGGVFLLTAIFFFLHIGDKSSSKINNLHQLQQKLQVLNKQLNSELTKNEIEMKLKEHEQATYTLRAQKALLLNAESNHEKYTEQFVDWQYEEDLLKDKLKSMAKQYRFNETLSTKAFRESFNLLEEGKKKVLTLQRLETAERQVHNELVFWDEEVKALCTICSIDFQEKWQRVFETLYAKLSIEKEKQYKKLEFENEKKKLMVNYSQWNEKCLSIERQCEQLLKQANVTNEEDFIKKAHVNKKANDIKQKITLLDAQLSTQIKAEEKEVVNKKLNNGKKQVQEELYELETHLNALMTDEEKVQQQITSNNLLTEQLEADGSYSELLQQYEIEKSKLNKLAEEWAVLAIASNVLERTKNEFRLERLPKVIKVATQYLTIFTKHRYVKILAPIEENSFIVERKDGRRFSPKELSRGTKEQLYLALRLALANVYPSQTPYPLIVDDIFVNFDSIRTKRAVEVLRKASEDHQVIFFTCHHHLLIHFTDKEVTTLSVKANGIQEEGYEVS